MKAQTQKSSRFAGLTESELAKLIQQYGCGPVRFSGTDEALYERHLVFDNVMEMSAIGARERFEAIAHSVRDVLSQRWIHTENTYDRPPSPSVRWSIGEITASPERIIESAPGLSVIDGLRSPVHYFSWFLAES